MGSQPSHARRGWLSFGRALALGALPLSLAGQGLPALPELPGLEALPASPNPGELLPLRPMPLEPEAERKEPLRLRGRNVEETPDGWTLVDGAVEGKDLLLLADRIQYSQATGQVEAEGHIRLEGPGRAPALRPAQDGLEPAHRRSLRPGAGTAPHLGAASPPRSNSTPCSTGSSSRSKLSPCPEEKPGWKALRLQAEGGPGPLRDAAQPLDLGVRPADLLLPALGHLPGQGRAHLGRAADLHVLFRPQRRLPRRALLPGAGQERGRHHHPPVLHQGGHPVERRPALGPRAHPPGRSPASTSTRTPTTSAATGINIKELWQREDGWQFTADINRASDTLLDTDYGSGISRLGTNTFDSATYLGKNFPGATSTSPPPSSRPTSCPTTRSTPPVSPPPCRRTPCRASRQPLPDPLGILLPGRRRAAEPAGLQPQPGTRSHRRAAEFDLHLEPDRRHPAAGGAAGPVGAAAHRPAGWRPVHPLFGHPGHLVLRNRQRPQRQQPCPRPMPTRTPSSSTAPPRTGCWARPGCSSPPRPSAGRSRTCTSSATGARSST